MPLRNIAPSPSRPIPESRLRVQLPPNTHFRITIVVCQIPKGNQVSPANHLSGKLWFAQDSQGRHVVINIVPADSDELRVYELIKEQSLETLQQACLLPVLDILPLGQYRFVVMPRWGSTITNPPPGTLKEVLEILHSMLKALNFLHSHNIVHRDIALKNVLVNHYCSDSYKHILRGELRSDGLLSYAMIDFNISVAFPLDAERSACRLPSDMSCYGSWPQPDDVAEGDIDYDPFAYDVGCMGILFCTLVQAYTAAVPFLAPFLDKMTAKDISRRFTACEALQFFESHLKETSPEALAEPYEEVMTAYFDEYDRWSAIPIELAEKWAGYREGFNPLP